LFIPKPALAGKVLGAVALFNDSGRRHPLIGRRHFDFDIRTDIAASRREYFKPFN
jgi:hypothetical protein